MNESMKELLFGANAKYLYIIKNYQPISLDDLYKIFKKELNYLDYPKKTKKRNNNIWKFVKRAIKDGIIQDNNENLNYISKFEHNIGTGINSEKIRFDLVRDKKLSRQRQVFRCGNEWFEKAYESEAKLHPFKLSTSQNDFINKIFIEYKLSGFAKSNFVNETFIEHKLDNDDVESHNCKYNPFIDLKFGLFNPFEILKNKVNDQIIIRGILKNIVSEDKFRDIYILYHNIDKNKNTYSELNKSIHFENMGITPYNFELLLICLNMPYYEITNNELVQLGNLLLYDSYLSPNPTISYVFLENVLSIRESPITKMGNSNMKTIANSYDSLIHNDKIKRALEKTNLNLENDKVVKEGNDDYELKAKN